MAQWLPEARGDANAIAGYYDGLRPATPARPSLGDDFIDALQATEAAMDAAPLATQVQIQPDTRRALVAAPFGAYGIYYRVDISASGRVLLLIVAVVHTQRNPQWIARLVGQRP